MRVVETKVYTYNELDDAAKAKAREWYAGLVFSDSNDWDHVFDDAVRMAEILGIDIDTKPVKLMGGGTGYKRLIYFSGFWSQGDGACFEGYYRYKKGAAKAIREEAPEDKELHRIADALQAVQRWYFYKLRATMSHHGRYSHSGCMSVDVDYYDDRYRDISDAEDEVTQLMRDFADWIYAQLEKEYEYQTSDEQVAESIIANEYEFTEDGALA